MSTINATANATANVTDLRTAIVHADLGMPFSARLRVSWLRGAGSTGVADIAVQSCALVTGIAVTDPRSVMTDAAYDGAFPGAPAWSPPI